MCATCGCEGEHAHAHEEHAHDGRAHSHDGHTHSHEDRTIRLEEAILARNDALAALNRKRFEAQGIVCFNFVSSPGSGKTTLLEQTLRRLPGRVPVSVIEGDQATTRDADRIRATGTPAIQINTGAGCHLDAAMIADAIERLQPPAGSLLFVENVGNLVCPALFDLGERSRVAVISVAEGDDKPLKYPRMFEASDVLVVNKMDLLPHVLFDVPSAVASARRLRRGLRVFEVSATRGDGLEAWCSWLTAQLPSPVAQRSRP